MTRYYVVVSDELLDVFDSWIPVDGFRLVEVVEKRGNRTSVCLFEDDGAPAVLEGKTVTPIFRSEYQDGGTRKVIIGGYEVTRTIVDRYARVGDEYKLC